MPVCTKATNDAASGVDSYAVGHAAANKAESETETDKFWATEVPGCGASVRQVRKGGEGKKGKWHPLQAGEVDLELRAAEGVLGH